MTEQTKRLPEWATKYAEAWDDGHSDAYEACVSGIRLVLDRLEKTREKDRDASNDPGMDLINEGRERVREEVLDDQP